MKIAKISILVSLFLPFSAVAQIVTAPETPASWKYEFPKNGFTKSSIDLSEIMSGGPPRDGIPPIDKPKFLPASKVDIPETEPVLGLTVNGEFKAYPIRVLTWHEIVNDEIAGVPITATFCPLCNAAIVFDRRIQGKVLDFGTTGKLRNSDLLMYDRQTETFWQQAIGTGIVGPMTGVQLKMIPARLESFAKFKKRAGEAALVLVPSDGNARSYGRNPYEGYDEASSPFLYNGEMPDNIEPMIRVVTTKERKVAYSLTLLREKQTITAADGTVYSWSEGQNSALGASIISKGRDVGNIVAQQNGTDVVYFVEFAFVFHAFSPKGIIIR